MKDVKEDLIDKIRLLPVWAVSFAYVYAYCLGKYGADIREKWKTITEQKAALDRAYTQGRMDEAARWWGKDVD